MRVHDHLNVRSDRRAGVTIVAVRGEVDLTGGNPVADAIVGAFEGREPGEALIVDLCGCEFMDSSGIHAVVRGLRAAESRRVRYAVACPPAGAAARALDLALRGLVSLHEDLPAALTAVGATDAPVLRALPPS